MTARQRVAHSYAISYVERELNERMGENGRVRARMYERDSIFNGDVHIP